MADLGGRVLVLEEQMQKLLGNGQPGQIRLIWDRLEDQSRTTNRGIGLILGLQAAIGIFLGLLASGVIKMR